MMVSYSNGSLSGNASNKRPLENGFVPKYKSRKVSAVRDFPAGFVLNDVPSNLIPEQNGHSEAGSMDAAGVTNLETANAVVDNGAGVSGVADLKDSEAVGNSEVSKAKLNEIKNSEIQNGVKNSNIEVEWQPHEAVNGDLDVGVTKSLDAIVEDVMENVNVSKKLVMEIGPLGIQLPEETGFHRHEALDNPIEMERDGLLDSYAGKVTTMIMNGFSNEVEELIPETGTKPEASIRPRDKYRPRRVSAFREFPSRCGSHVSLPVEEKEMAVSGNDCPNMAEKVESAPEAAVPRNVLERGTTDEVLTASRKDCLDGLHNVPVENETTETLNDGATRGFLVNSAGGGLEDSENCNRDLQHFRVDSSGASPGSGTISKAVADTSTKDTGGPAGKNIAVCSPYRNDKEGPQRNDFSLGNDSKREIVHGLMAAPYCPWRKSKVDGGTSGQKKRQQNLCQTEKPWTGGGLEDSENCNRDLQHCGIDSSGASPGSGTKSKAVADTSLKDTGGPAGKNIAVCSPDRNDKEGPQYNDFSLGNDSKREIVHGLMASPHCPWRKSKVDGGTGGRKKRQQNLSQTEKPKASALNSNLEANYSGEASAKTALPDSNDVDGSPGSLAKTDKDVSVLDVAPISMVEDVHDNSDNEHVGPVGNDIIVYSPGDTDEMRPLHNVTISEDEVDREVVHDLMAAPCPRRKRKTVTRNFDREMSGEKKRKKNVSLQKKSKAAAKKSTPKLQTSGSASKKEKKVHISNDVDGSPADLILGDDGDPGLDGDCPTNSPANHKPQDFEVNLPPFGPTSSGNSDARNKVRETLRFFHAIYRKLLQQEEAHSKPEEEGKSGKRGVRIDLMTAKVLKERGKLVNPDKVIGPLPGVEVGDEFQYRVELAVVGIHFPFQSGIDSTKINDVPLATSIVSSGGYSDNLDDADVLIYSGQGGNVVGNQKAKQAEDQKLERGNLALKNCIDAQTPVRVVRGWKETKYVDPLDSRPKMVTTYIYDGLYTVTRFWTEKGPRGKQVFQFELKRNPGQPELAWKELKKSNKFKTRPGTCVADISGGKESSPICAVNTLDDEKPPPFNYIPKMMYPDWYQPKPPAACDCTGRCSGSKKCRCAVANGGEIPYNRNGALVETKALVYECGPHCKCPPSCYNRVSQRGIKFKLEIFKTESRGWGVRPLTSIPSGSFICEYAGELLEDKEAEQRIGNDEYLFDIGQNYIDSSKPEEQEIAAELNEEGGFTIDACQYGNVGRFINHSCSPNLHAQNVIHDHDDKRMPHIMLFAMENIPPLQELTYHYNYAVDQVCDSDGNIKVKSCYCGSAQCTGRMY